MNNEQITPRELKIHGNTVNALSKRGYDVEVFELTKGDVRLYLYEKEEDSEPTLVYQVMADHHAYDLNLVGAYVKNSTKEELSAFANVSDLIRIADFLNSEK